MTAAPRALIIGGGAAGFFAAITLAEALPEAEVTILERSQKVLEKVRISGGGRCNVTHACFVPRELCKFYPRGERELLGPFTRFAPGDMMDWLYRRGVETKIEDDNRVFPSSDDAMSIVNCLRGAAEAAGVRVLLGQRVQALRPDGQGWLVETAGQPFRAEAVFVGTGSNTAMWDLLAGLGHQIVPPVPSLFTFNISDARIEGLPGLSVPDAGLRVADSKLQARGPLLVTHWGLSGPGILRLSAWGARDLHGRQYQFELRVNWLGGQKEADWLDEWEALRQAEGKKSVMGHPAFGLPRRLWERLVAAAGIGPEKRRADLSKKDSLGLAAQILDSRLPVTGKSTFKEEFVTSGGVRLAEVDFKTMQSKLLPGLYLAGEALDIDAITGGFNFQAAWTGAWIAGQSMAERLRKGGADS